MNFSPALPHMTTVRGCSPTFARSYAVLLLGYFALAGTLTVQGDEVPTRYEAKFADGERWTGQRLSDWSNSDPHPQLDGRELFNRPAALLWLRDSQANSEAIPPTFIETILGDRLPGRVTGHQSGSEFPFQALPDHLLVEPTFETRPPQDRDGAPLRIATRWVRRIVWLPSRLRYQPGLAVLKDGRRLSYRALRWQPDAVVLLLDEERRKIAWEELADLHLRTEDQWEGYFDELTVLTADSNRLLQVETNQGLVATTSWTRYRAYARGNAEDSGSWIHGVQPAWSLDVLWLPADSISWRRFFKAKEVLLSRVTPQRIVQHSTLAGFGRPWRKNLNVDGGPLASSEGLSGWGFGVHAHNELHFALPSAARGFRSMLGLDRIAKKGGCIEGQVQVADGDTRNLFTSQVIVGSKQVLDTGNLPLGTSTDPQGLVLQVFEAHKKRPAGADPFDICDSADWIEPIVTLDTAAIEPPLADRFARQVDAWRSWHLVSAPADLKWSTAWDELSAALPSFRLAVTGDRTPMILEREIRLSADQRWLAVHASCGQKSEAPPHIEVSADGQRLAGFEVPLLDRDHLNARPLIVPLERLTNRSGTIRLQIQQIPDAARTPVLWHSLSIAQHRPDIYEVFDERGAWSKLAGDGKVITASAMDDPHHGLRAVRIPSGAAYVLSWDKAVAIRERPLWGEYRFIRFAFRSNAKGAHATVRLLSRDGTHESVYEAGPRRAENRQAHQVWDRHLPEQWTLITRDVARDFGNLDLIGIQVQLSEGQEVSFDSIYLARSLDDFANWDREQRDGD